MNEPPNNNGRGGRRSFTADLTLSLALPWLVIWRAQLALGDPLERAEFWSGWLPLVAAIVLIAIGVTIGAAYRTGRGFLPYPVRWLGLAGVVVLLAWGTVDTATTDGPRSGDRGGLAAQSLADAEAAFATASKPEDKKVAQQAKTAAESVSTFEDLVATAEKQGVAIPSLPTGDEAGVGAAAGATGAATPGQQAAALLREYGDDLAAGEVPPELAAAAEGMGLEGELLQQAGMALAAFAIAEYTGMPYLVVIKILVELLADGEVTMGEVIRMGTAVALSVDGSGLNTELLGVQFDKAGEYAQTMEAFMESAEAYGAETQVRKPLLWDALKDTARDAAGSGTSVVSSDCDPAAIQAAVESSLDVDERARALGLSDNEACRRLTSEERRALVEQQGGG